MQRLDRLAARLHLQRPQQRLAAGRERMSALRERLLHARATLHERAVARALQIGARLQAQHPHARLQQLTLRNDTLHRRLVATWQHAGAQRQQRLTELARALNAISPLGVLQRGYAILFDETGDVLRSVRGVTPGTRLRARLADGELPLRVETPD